jgi:predicted RNA-binding protein with PUA-like domain
MATQYWVMKCEPEVFSIQDLAKAPKKTTFWEGVRNYQARNWMRSMKVGDGVVFYHSNAEPTGAAGIAEVVREAYPDLTALDKKSPYYDAGATKEDPRWSMVDIQWKGTFREVVPLDALRKAKALKKMILLRPGNRFSVTPATAAEWKVICKLGGL